MGNSPSIQQSSYKIASKKGKKNLYVRGSYKGHRLDTSTGARTESEAAGLAAQMWAEHIQWVDSGKAQVYSTTSSSAELNMEIVGLTWASEKGDREATTEGYVHRISMLSKYFPSVRSCSTESVENFIQVRLREVRRSTLMKDQRVLRAILRFARTQGLIREVPSWELPERSQRGKAHPRGKAPAQHATAAEVEKILAGLPASTRNQKLPAQAICRILWETGLRPELLWRLTTPRHWKPGNALLNITEDISKIGLARQIELTPRALEALQHLHGLYSSNQAAETENGEHFLAPAWGKSGLKRPDLRKALLAAAVPVLGEERGAHFSPSSFRPSRITDSILKGANPAKLGRVVGQTSSSIQDRYLRVNDDDIRYFETELLGA